MKIPGLSFSWKRALGVTAMKQKVARATGIPTTRGGLERNSAGSCWEPCWARSVRERGDKGGRDGGDAGKGCRTTVVHVSKYCTLYTEVQYFGVWRWGVVPSLYGNGVAEVRTRTGYRPLTPSGSFQLPPIPQR